MSKKGMNGPQTEGVQNLFLVTHPKLLDGLNYKSKGEDNRRRKSWDALPGS